MDTVYKVTDGEVKKIGDRKYEFIASTSTLDRDGEVIDVDGWDLTNFKKNPVIPWAHNYQNPPVARATRVWKHNGQLKNQIEFPAEGDYEFADTIERLVDSGFIKAQSVGFIPKEWEDGDGEKAPRRTYKKQELLEISLVPVPSNPDALRNALDAGIITAKQFKKLEKDMEIIEVICPHCGCDRIEPAIEDMKNIWLCCECGKAFDTLTKPEENEEFIRIPNPKDDKNHDDHRIRTIQIDEGQGITALYCGECKVVKTYIFAKAKGWTMAKAKKWVEDHSKNLIIIEPELIGYQGRAYVTQINLDGEKLAESMIDNIEDLAKEAKIALDKPITQEEIKDEMDYLKDCLNDAGLSDDSKPIAIELMETIKRLTGDDIPDDIKGEDVMTKEEVIKIINVTITDVIERAQGKV